MANGSGFAAWVGAPSAAGAQVVMLDVGQGDSMLVRDDGAAVLIDTGEEADVLSRALARHGVTHLDAVFVTHKDSDHVGALSGMAGVVGIDHVYIHADLLDWDGEEQVLEAARRVTAGRGAQGVRPGDVCRAGAFSIEVLAPREGGESGNEDSLQMLVAYDADGDGAPEARGFTSGDAEEEAVADTVAAVGDVDFAKVPHHGSRGGLSEDELAVLKPEIALIGVGADNSYGHPTRQMLGLLEQARAKVYRTDENGDVTLRFAKDSIDVAVQKR
jgi:competence protein ComEC